MNKKLKHTCDILSAVQSIYVKQFLALADEINRNLVEAKSNIEYLQVLKEPCEELATVKSPEIIPTHLSEIMHLIRFIWLNSPYYNTVERITNLCRSLTNQIIIQCTKYLDLNVVFKDKHSKKAIKMFQICIDCCVRYIQIYVLVS